MNKPDVTITKLSDKAVVEINGSIPECSIKVVNMITTVDKQICQICFYSKDSENFNLCTSTSVLQMACKDGSQIALKVEDLQTQKIPYETLIIEFEVSSFTYQDLQELQAL